MGLSLNIVTPEREALAIEVDSVVVPGAEGEFGVLPEHEPFLAPLKPGVVRYSGGPGSGRVAVASGFAEVTGDHVTLLVQSAESSHEIDRPRAEAALQRAEEALRHTGPDTPAEEVEPLRDQYARASSRLEASG